MLGWTHVWRYGWMRYGKVYDHRTIEVPLKNMLLEVQMYRMVVKENGKKTLRVWMEPCLRPKMSRYSKTVRTTRSDKEIKDFWKHHKDLEWSVDDNTIEKFFHWLRGE